MTLVQASICDKGNTIILIADRMVSSSMGEVIRYEKEGNASKLYIYNKNAIGFAGSVPDIIKIKKRIKGKDNIDDFLNGVIEIMKAIKDEALDRTISVESIWKSKKEFIENLQICPKPLKDAIFARNASFRLEMNCIIAGFNKNGDAKIYLLNNEYEVNDITDFHYYSVGSGSPFSLLFFDQEEYSENCTLNEGLYFAYCAKKTAESHIGVGVQTDIVILRKEKNAIDISASDQTIRELESFYIGEIRKIHGLREEIFKKINLEEN